MIDDRLLRAENPSLAVLPSQPDPSNLKIEKPHAARNMIPLPSPSDSGNDAGGARAVRGLAVYADQATSTLTNFVMTFLALQSGSSAEFGSFILVYGALQIAIAANRAVTAEPLMVEAGDSEALARSTGPATGLAIVNGIGLGLLGVLLSTLVADDVARQTILIGSVLLPGLLLLDTTRFVFFAEGRPRRALRMDGLWGILLVGGALGLGAADALTPTTVFLTWAVAGSLSATIAVVIDRIVPSIRGVVPWFRSTVHLSGRYLGEELVKTGSTWLVFFLVARGVSVAALGVLSGARILFGPLNLLFLATHAYGVTEGTRMIRESKGPHFRRVMYGVSVGLAALPFVLALIIRSIPESLGQTLIPTWVDLASVVYLVAIRVSAIGAIAGLRVILRAYRAPRKSLHAEVAGSIALPAATAVGVIPGTIEAAAIGTGIGQWIGVPFWIRAVRRAVSTDSRTSRN